MQSHTSLSRIGHQLFCSLEVEEITYSFIPFTPFVFPSCVCICLKMFASLYYILCTLFCYAKSICKKSNMDLTIHLHSFHFIIYFYCCILFNFRKLQIQLLSDMQNILQITVLFICTYYQCIFLSNSVNICSALEDTEKEVLYLLFSCYFFFAIFFLLQWGFYLYSTTGNTLILLYNWGSNWGYMM